MGSPRKSPNGHGSIYQEGENWVAAVTLPTGKRVKRRRRTKKEANDALLELINQRANGSVNPSTITVSTILDKWMKNRIVGRGKKKTTAETYKRIAEGIIKPTLGNVKVANLSIITIEGWVMELKESDMGLSANRINHAVRVLGTALSYAIKIGVISSNPCHHVDRLEHTPKKIEVFTEEEVDEILSFAESCQYRVVYHLGLQAGMRIGEILGLKWSDIDLDGPVPLIQISRTRSEIAGKVFDDTPKTAKSARTIEIPDPVVDVLVEHMVKSRQSKSRLGDDGEYVITSSSSKKRAAISTIYYNWKMLLERAGLPYRSFHTCRHTYASYLLSANVPVKIVSMMLGHANPMITMRVYAHMMPNDQKIAVGVINKMFAKSEPVETDSQ